MGRYLYETYLEEGLGVSFKGQGLVWNTAQDVAPVVQAMNECKNMKYLELEGNTLGVEAAKEIGKALESHPELEIALWKDLFTTRDKREIPRALDFLFAGVDLAGAHIQRLDLSDNAVGPMGMPGVTPFFRTPSSFYLEELIVNNEGMGIEGGTIFSSALMECLELSQASGDRVLQLKVFQCGRNRQENKGTMSWAKLFQAIGTLEEVHMPQNGMNPPGIKALAEAFENNPQLRVINLEDNTVRHDGVELLCRVLPNLAELEELNLSDCLIRNAGAEHLATAIRHLQELRSLTLVSNEIKSGGGMNLASILRELPSLVHVDLSGNEFGLSTVSDIEHLLENVNEVIIEDDEGEGGDYEEEEGEGGEHDDEGEEEEEENWEPELTADKARSGSQTVIEPVSPPVVPISPFGSLAVNQVDSAPAFIADPTIETYMRLLPKPSVALTQYFRHQKAHEFQDLCIYAAIAMSQIMGPNTPENFNILLDEALGNGTSNAFATSLLVCLGFMKAEKGDSRLICKPTDRTIKALAEYLRYGHVPVTVFQCIHHFISQAAAVDSFSIINSEYKNLLEVIRARMGGLIA